MGEPVIEDTVPVPATPAFVPTEDATPTEPEPPPPPPAPVAFEPTPPAFPCPETFDPAPT